MPGNWPVPLFMLVISLRRRGLALLKLSPAQGGGGWQAT